ncbi:MAG: glycosyl transferase group 1 [Solirubrobacterales bacterium]|nr:glycosyl transferase group 1 [Solirubrobacterales bacterium]
MNNLVAGLMFFPRGGSAHALRAIATELPTHGWRATVVSGSVAGAGDATRFFDGLDVRTVDMTAALGSPDPLRADPPLHPSYEDRPGAPDRVFAAVDDVTYDHQVAAWAEALVDAGALDADLLYLHHLTPLHEAAARVAPGVPVVGHLHGTELLMLEAIADGPPGGWDHADRWAARMRRWAQACARLLVLTPTAVARAAHLLDIDPERCVVVPNGFDPGGFAPAPMSLEERLAHWRRHLVEVPTGWAPGMEAGGVTYTDDDLGAIAAGGPVFLYVGRFTAVKRVGLLVRAFARVQSEVGAPMSLVLVGGHPGEWEGEHPLEGIEASGARNVFLAGWHEHSALPDFLHAGDAIVLPSVREQFGQVLVEGMACGLPAIAVDNHGPADIVEDGETGWLVQPDDLEGLAAALHAVAADPEERRRRGGAARESVAARYAWPSLAERVAAVLDDAHDEAGEPHAAALV